MNYKKKLIERMKKSTAILATTLILGQAALPGMTVFAEISEETQEEVVQSTVDGVHGT